MTTILPLPLYIEFNQRRFNYSPQSVVNINSNLFLSVPLQHNHIEPHFDVDCIISVPVSEPVKITAIPYYNFDYFKTVPTSPYRGIWTLQEKMDWWKIYSLFAYTYLEEMIQY